MSEFRKYRLVSKLLENFQASEAPQKYVNLLNELSSSSSSFGRHRSDLNVDELARQSEDSSRFMQLAQALRDQDEYVNNRFCSLYL